MPALHPIWQKNSPSVRPRLWLIVLSVALFVLALAPRLLGLREFVTADEAKWVYRSAQFWLALLEGDWAGTAVNPTPAVPTTWAGGLGLWLFNALHEGRPFAEFLAAVPQWTVDPAQLYFARLPTILLSAGLVVLLFHLLRPAFGLGLAFGAALLVAFDPLLMAHSRFLHHDALVTIFALPSVLFAVHASRGSWAAVVASGVLAGLAFVTKSSLFFLAPFALGLFLITSRTDLRLAATRFAVWGGLSYLSFVAVWPAAWVGPIQAPLSVILNAAQAAAPDALAEVEYFPQLGLAYYPVYWLYYSSPLVLGGLALLAWRWRDLQPPRRAMVITLLAFALSFMAFMTLSDKRSARYILPSFVALTIAGAVGYALLAEHLRRTRLKTALLTGVILLHASLTLWHAPYFITYLNPLLGGPMTAPQVIKLGWGEGMEQVGAWLDDQPHAPALRVAASYASTLTPYFSGQVTGPRAAEADFVIDYIKQRQGDHPALLAYWNQQEPRYSVRLHGVDYARIFDGPPLQPVPASDELLAFRLSHPFAPRGGQLEADLVWARPPQVEYLSLHQGDTLLAEARSSRLPLPAELPPGPLTLKANGLTLTELTARPITAPAEFRPEAVSFGDELALVGSQVVSGTASGALILRLAWQATPRAWADYTLFAHLIDAEGQRLSGFDTQPPQPTSQWRGGEVILTEHPLTRPADLSDYRFRVGVYRADTGESLGEAVVLDR